MGDLAWPSNIKPLTSRNYSTSRGANVVSTSLRGGLPRANLDTLQEAIPFQLNFVLSPLQYQVVLSFYDGGINHGANSFKMMLDSGNGIEEHQCTIQPGTWKATRPNHNNWVLSVTLIAESSSSQELACPNLYELYECYGERVCDVINGLENFALGVPSE